MNNVARFMRVSPGGTKRGFTIGKLLADKVCSNHWCNTQGRKCVKRSYMIEILYSTFKADSCQYRTGTVWLCGFNMTRLTDEEAAVYLL